MMKKIIKIIFGISFSLLFFLFCFFFIGTSQTKKDISWGVNFSQKHTMLFGLDWQKAYLAILKELKAKELKLITHWDQLEPQKNDYFFEDLDWQIKMAEEEGAKIILVIGMKTPRWPECHLPRWSFSLPKEEQQERILLLLEKIVNRYKNSPAIWAWQVENEPLFPFGVCPWKDKNFLIKEVSLVKSLDPSRPVVISDSGEWSFWCQAGKIGDIVGFTTYRKVFNQKLNRPVTYPFPPVFYKRKMFLVEKLLKKEALGVELQAEPWGRVLLYDLSYEEQRKLFSLEDFRKNILFANKKIGAKKFYLWGVEWWYWLKIKHQNEDFWEEAKNLFR